MRRRAIVSLLGSCLLAACAHQGESVATQGMGWSLQHNEGEGAKLAYGAPQSDHVVLMMTCAPQSERVLLSVGAGSAQGPGVVELISDGRKSRLAGEAVPSGLGAGSLMEAAAGLDDPALAGFARSGRLALVDRGRTAELSATAEERGEVDGFFATCRA